MRSRAKTFPFVIALILLAAALLACSMTPVTPEMPAPEQPTPLPPEGQAEGCVRNEVYHPEEGLCYVSEAEAELAFFTAWGDPYIRRVPELPGANRDSMEQDVALVLYEIRDDTLADPIRYDVPDRLLPEQTDFELHLKLWNFFAAVIPPDQRAVLRNFEIITDGPDGILAAVEQTQQDAYLWELEVDTSDSADVRDLAETLVHEFGHLLTLNPAQVPPNLDVYNNPDNDNIYYDAEDACPTYFPGEGCSYEESYINRFFQRFWAGETYEEWLAIDRIPDDDEYEYALEEFYNRRQEQFVSDYAVTDPSEDIAESWMEFVLTSRPVGDTIAEEKILFFYEYPELVSLRAQIQARLASRLIRFEP